jgi:large subunit ribosomal protein L3
MIGLIGKKIGMTQIFEDNGKLVPVTVIKIEPNVVVRTKAVEKDGYAAVVLGAFDKKESRVSRPVLGQYPEGVSPKSMMCEMRDFDKPCEPGETFGVDLFEEIPFVDVVGTSKGKGYQGVMKRHGFRGGRKTHGSKFHRANGSTGMAAWPSRVIKGTKMAGRMGGARTTAQNLKVVKVDPESGTLVVRGAVPGANNGYVLVSGAKKKKAI